MSPSPHVARSEFGRDGAGRQVDRIVLSNGRGLRAEVLSYGGILRALHVPDGRGISGDVVLGFDSIEPYLGPHPYFGGIIGRYGNRIARGRFRLDGREFTLAKNDGTSHLHGGLRGFDRVLWTAETVVNAESASVTLRRVSPDGEEGYPGALSCSVTYCVNAADELRVDYRATTDRPTIVNLTHHSYFDLSAGAAIDVRNHELSVAASAFLPVDDTLIPEGPPSPVEGTPFDLRAPARLGPRIDSDHPQIRRGRGFDHNFVLDDWIGPAMNAPRAAARLVDPSSGRAMSVLTTEPGLQVYTGGFLDGLPGKDGRAYGPHRALCLETQHFPDSPNRPDFPSTRLDAGNVYRSTTIYRFETGVVPGAR